MFRILGFTCLLLAGTCTANLQASRLRLLDDLLSGYGDARLVLPQTDAQQPVTVYMGMGLLRGEIDDERGVFHANVWMRHLWTDNRLLWDPEMYDGLTSIHVPSKLIWKPDIKLYNSVDPVWLDEDTNVVVYSDGSVLWIPPTKVTVAYSEYDGSGSLMFKFGSWTYSGLELDVSFYEGQANIDLSDYIYQSSYQIVSTRAERFEMFYPCCEEYYPVLNFYMDITRSD